MTDTAAYSDAVFGLFWLLGYQFSPRLADLGDARLWRIDRKADYPKSGSWLIADPARIVGTCGDADKNPSSFGSPIG